MKLSLVIRVLINMLLRYFAKIFFIIIAKVTEVTKRSLYSSGNETQFLKIGYIFQGTVTTQVLLFPAPYDIKR